MLSNFIDFASKYKMVNKKPTYQSDNILPWVFPVILDCHSAKWSIVASNQTKWVVVLGHRAECYCLLRHVLTVPSLSTSGISICMSRTYQLWLVNKFSFGNTWVALQISAAVNQTVWCEMSVPRCDRINNSTLIKGRPHCSQSVYRFDDIFNWLNRRLTNSCWSKLHLNYRNCFMSTRQFRTCHSFRVWKAAARE